jgi:hypothetical protein
LSKNVDKNLHYRKEKFMTTNRNAQVAAHRDLGEPETINADNDEITAAVRAGEDADWAAPDEDVIHDDQISPDVDERTPLQRAVANAQAQFPNVTDTQAAMIVRAFNVANGLYDHSYRRSEVTWALVSLGENVLSAAELLLARMGRESELREFADYVVRNSRD